MVDRMLEYRAMLRKRPEQKILAVLGDFYQRKPVEVIRQIIKEIYDQKKGSLAEYRYFNQLRILVQLRDLEEQFYKAMESIHTFFKEEKDPYFRREAIKGELRAKTKLTLETTKRMVLKTDLNDEAIASLIDVTIAFVKRIRKKLKPVSGAVV